MMFGRFVAPIGYSRELECRVLELPFTQRRISLFILLPDDPELGIQRLAGNMTSDNVKRLFSTLKVAFCSISIWLINALVLMVSRCSRRTTR